MNRWQRLHEQYAQDAFQGNGHAYTQEAKIADLERLIGQQTLEISFLPQSFGRQQTRAHAAQRIGKAQSHSLNPLEARQGSSPSA